MQHHLASPQLVFTPQLIPASMWRRRTAHQPMLACAHGTVKSPHVTWAPEAPQQHGADAQCKPALCWECVLHRTESASGHGWESRASFPLSDPGGLTSPQSLWEMIWWLPCPGVHLPLSASALGTDIAQQPHGPPFPQAGQMHTQGNMFSCTQCCTYRDTCVCTQMPHTCMCI